MSVEQAFFLVCLGICAICATMMAGDHYKRLSNDARMWRRFVACMDKPSSAAVILEQIERTYGGKRHDV